jgi:hypothetical protein
VPEQQALPRVALLLLLLEKSTAERRPKEQLVPRVSQAESPLKAAQPQAPSLAWTQLRPARAQQPRVQRQQGGDCALPSRLLLWLVIRSWRQLPQPLRPPRHLLVACELLQRRLPGWNSSASSFP